MAFSAAAREADIALLLAAQVHLGTKVRLQLCSYLGAQSYQQLGALRNYFSQWLRADSTSITAAAQHSSVPGSSHFPELELSGQ